MVNPNLTGSHTQKKLAVLTDYLQFYSSSLQNKNFVLAYIDAFAGTGTLSKTPKSNVLENDFFYQETIDDKIVTEMAGSAILALEIEPALEHLIFIEKSPSRAKQLEKLKKSYPQRKIHIYNQDANIALPELCNRVNWKGSKAPGLGVRAVAFLDPFGMQLNWTTLKAIQKTEAIDIWYLFPTHAILRQATNDASNISSDKENALNRVLGGSWWRKEFYDENQYPENNDLFNQGHKKNISGQRFANASDVEKAFGQKLNTLFPYVHPEPLRLRNANVHMFSLFFAVSNPDHRAISLARKGAEHLLKNAQLKDIHSMSGLYKSGQ